MCSNETSLLTREPYIQEFIGLLLFRSKKKKKKEKEMHSSKSPSCLSLSSQ